MDGVFVVDKPAGFTSHDVVNKMRRIAGTKRVGHLGTLDPIATGVLPLVVGRATRLAQFYMGMPKTYDTIIRFGQATDSYDRDGEPIGDPVPVTLDAARLQDLLPQFTGALQQVPPPISAKKIRGIPAYKLARRNKPVDLPPVPVTVDAIELVSCDGADARLIIRCSAGTYVRGIAHDLGQLMGCGAHVNELRRTASGEFCITQARTLDDLQALSKEARLAEALIPAGRLLPEMPSEIVDAVTVERIRQGRDFRVSPFRVRQGTRHVKAVSPTGELVAIGEAKLPNVYHPWIVL